MKIEHIIADIIVDVTTWKMILEERFRQVYPSLNFSIATPDLEELSTVKSIVLTVAQGDSILQFGVLVHTHNGNRVFENSASNAMKADLQFCTSIQPVQKQFVALLREIIKKQKKFRKSSRGMKSILNRY